MVGAMDEREYLERHLPAGADSGHDVLYDFEGRFASYCPDAARLEACLVDLLPILARVRFAPELYEDGHDATELALALLARGRERGLPRPAGPVVPRLRAEIERIRAAAQLHSDADKRLDGILALLTDPDWRDTPPPGDGWPTTPIARIRHGEQVRVAGRVVALEQLIAPVTRRDCVAYQVVLDEFRCDGVRFYFAALGRDLKMCDVLVEDAAGQRARVDARKAVVTLERDLTLRTQSFERAPPYVADLLRQLGLAQTGLAVRCEERVLEEGHMIVVEGRARLEPDAGRGTVGSGYRDAPMRVVLHGEEGAPLRVWDG